MHLAQFRGSGERRVKIDALRGGQQLDGDDGTRIGRHVEQPPGGEGGHAHVIFLVGRRGQAVDAGRVGERLVLRGERGGGDVGHHEAGVEACFSDKEGRQAGERGVDQQSDAPLRQGADFRDGQRQCVGGQRHRLGVEVAAGEHFAGVGEDEWIVGHRVGLDGERRRGVAHEVEAGAHHLRLAAQAVGILHAVVVDQVRAADLAAGEQMAVLSGHVDLSGLAAQRLYPRVERCIAALGGVHRQGAGHQCRGEDVFRLEQSA